MTRRPWSLLAALLALAGTGVALALHLAPAGGWLADACREGGAACDEVLSSRWARFPPDVGAPVASLGLFYFIGLAVWLLLVGTPGRDRRELQAVLLRIVVAGCLVSLVYVALMALVVRSWCVLCLLVHGCHFLLLAALLLARGEDTEGIPPDHPRARLLLTAFLLAVAASAAAWWGGRAAALRAERDAAAAELATLVGDAARLELSYFADTRFTADEDARAAFDRVIRPDDPILPATPGTASTLVYFTDMACPNCHRFERFLSDRILPMYDGHLRVVFKHYPLDLEEGPSGPAARALEAARRQAAFWSMRELLLDRHDDLGRLDFAALAGELGLDVERFRADFDSPEVAERIRADKALGRQLGVEGTPTVFLDRREVGRRMRTLPGFWRLRVDALRRAFEARGEPW